MDLLAAVFGIVGFFGMAVFASGADTNTAGVTAAGFLVCVMMMAAGERLWNLERIRSRHINRRKVVTRQQTTNVEINNMYVIYRKADGTLDCIPDTSRLMAQAEGNILEKVDDTCMSAWRRLHILEKHEQEQKISEIREAAGYEKKQVEYGGAHTRGVTYRGGTLGSMRGDAGKSRRTADSDYIHGQIHLFAE